jgi:AcrR family transcriptional regulator
MPRISPQHEEELRRRILDGALRAFVQRGYHAATMQDVARESGLSVGALYTYFRGKEALLRATCDLAMSQELEALAEQLATARSLREKFELGVRFWFDRVIDDPATAFFIEIWREALSDEEIRQTLVRRRERLTAVATMLVQEGVSNGELPADLEVDAIARGFGALLEGLILQRIEDGPAFRRAPAERRALAFVELLYAAARVQAEPVAPVA